MRAAVLLVAMCVGGSDFKDGPVITQYVDLIEINHYYDAETGKIVLDQVIYWYWSDYLSEFVVIAWRLDKEEAPIRVVRRDTHKFDLIIFQNEILYHVRSPSYRETWTQFDPDLRNRRIVPKAQRMGLYNPRLKNQWD